MFVNWLDVGKLKSRLELILMKHEVLMRSTLTYNATYILEDCALEAKFHHKYHNDRDREFNISSLISLLKTFKISFQGNIWNENFRKSQVLPDKLVAMVIPDNLGNQK